MLHTGTSRYPLVKKHLDLLRLSSHLAGTDICVLQWVCPRPLTNGVVIPTEWWRDSHGAAKIVDDILIWASTPAELEKRIFEVVKRCEFLHVTLSRSKFQVDTSLNFAGCVVSDHGVRPDPARISALTNFPVPTDQTSVRSFLGLCNQLAFFIPNFQHHTVALRQLTGKGRFFYGCPSIRSSLINSKTFSPVT